MSPSRVIGFEEPFPYQREILLDDHRIKIACLGRQCGKSFLGRIAALDGHGGMVKGRPSFAGALHGGTVYWVTKDYPTGSLVWRDLMSSLVRWGGDLDISKIERRIGFPGGGSVKLLSGSNPDAMRGPTISGLVGDEVAFWHRDTLDALEPALMVKLAWRLLLSSPNGQNAYYTEWQKGEEHSPSRDPLYRSWRMPSSVSPLVSPDEFERIRATKSPLTFAREYLAEFRVKSGEIFQSDWFRYYTEDERMIYPELGPPVHKESLKYFLSADFALTKETYSDYTAIGVWAKAMDGRIFAVDLTRGRYSAAEIPPLVLRIQEQWEATDVHVETSGPLAKLNAECKVAGVRIRDHGIHGIHEGKKGWDKVSRAEQAAAAVQLGRVMFPKVKYPDGSYSPPPWVEELITECCSFPAKGVNDDRVDALSWAVIAVAPKKGAVSKPQVRRNDDLEERQGAWLIGR